MSVAALWGFAHIANAGVLTAPFIQQEMPQASIANAGLRSVSDYPFSLSSAAEHQTTLIDEYSSPTTLWDNKLLTLSSKAGGSGRGSELDEIVFQPAASLTAESSPLQVTTSGGDSATAIPLPPAVQSGITGIVALGMAGLFRSIRRALR